LADLNAWGEALRTELSSDEATTEMADDVRDGVGEERAGESDLHFPRIADISRRDPASSRHAQRTAALLENPVQTPKAHGLKSDSFELLDLLDDAVFDAIDGKQGAIEQLRSVWPLAKQQVGADLLGESKEQYIKRALATWHQNHNHGRAEIPAANVLEVLCIVFGV
jgi:hypothetical protein